MDVPGEKLPQQGDGSLASYLLQTVAPQVPQQLQPAFEEAIHAGRMRSMQNKQMPAAPLHCPGALLLGDAFNMRHPLTGGGMTVGTSPVAEFERFWHGPCAQRVMVLHAASGT